MSIAQHSKVARLIASLGDQAHVRIHVIARQSRFRAFLATIGLAGCPYQAARRSCLYKRLCEFR